MNINVVIVAGGKGKRMQSDLPKQFLELAGKPILMHTIDCFKSYADRILLVLPKDNFEIWNELVEKYNYNTSVELIEGGKERFFSVQNALACIPNDELVLIHDGVRPLVSEAIIQAVVNAIKPEQGVIPVVDLKESLREIQKEGSKPVDRAQFRLVQTPQGFCSTTIKQAYQVDFQDFFTDDASVFEHAGFSINLVSGHPHNIKVTLPEDLFLAQYLIQQ